MATLEEQSLG